MSWKDIKGENMSTFYDVLQLLKSFGIVIYMKERQYMLQMVEYEINELNRLGLISNEDYIRSKVIIKQEINKLDEGMR